MILDIVFSITLCAAGVFFAAHTIASERKPAVECAVALFLACIAYNLAWTPLAPHMLLGIRSTYYFSLISVLAASYSFERSLYYWWGLPLLCLYSLDICCHIIRSETGIDFYPVSLMVDSIAYMQIAIFVYIGGRGVRNRVANITDNIRHGARSHKTTQG